MYSVFNNSNIILVRNTKLYCESNLSEFITSIAAWIKNPFRRTSEHIYCYKELFECRRGACVDFSS